MARYIPSLHILLITLLISACGTGKKDNANPVYLDPDKPVDRRVEDLLARMTLEEKVGRSTGPVYIMTGLVKTFLPKKGLGSLLQETWLVSVPGEVLYPDKISREGTRQQAEIFNELQQLAIDKTRLDSLCRLKKGRMAIWLREQRYSRGIGTGGYLEYGPDPGCLQCCSEGSQSSRCPPAVYTGHRTQPGSPAWEKPANLQ